MEKLRLCPKGRLTDKLSDNPIIKYRYFSQTQYQDFVFDLLKPNLKPKPKPNTKTHPHFGFHFIANFFGGCGKQNILKPTSKFHSSSPSGGVPPRRGGLTDKLTDNFLYQICLKILIRGGGNRIFIKPTSKYLYPICHKYFLKPNPKTNTKNHSHFGFHFIAIFSGVGNRIFSNPEKKTHLQMFHLQIRNF